MPNINITAGEFVCSDPNNPYFIVVNIGTTYRTAQTYRFNYNWNSATYDSVGLPTKVQMYYSVDGQNAVLYTGTMPDNANNFLVSDFPVHDQMSFDLFFIVGDPEMCSKNEFINTADIQIAP